MNPSNQIARQIPPVLRLALAAIAWLCLSAAARAELHCWTTTDTMHVLRDDLPPAVDRPVEMMMARNEWRSFQILIRNDVRDDTVAAGIRLDAGDLHGPGNGVLRGEDAVLYRQQQIELTSPSYRNDHFKPGWYPDALVPFRNPITHQPLSGARFTAIPLDLPANQTHGFWVDLYVPPKTPAGDYHGNYAISSASGFKRTIPVTLRVWDFDLPPTPTLCTCFGSPASRMRQYYKDRAAAGKEKEPTDWNAIETQASQLLADNCIDATPPDDLLWQQRQADGSYLISDQKVAALRDFIDRYHVNAIEVSKPDLSADDLESHRDQVVAWFKSWDNTIARLHRPGVVFCIYLLDEPNDLAAYRYIQKWGKAIRATGTSVKVMVTEQTQTQDAAFGDLYGAVDIWTPLFPLFDPESAAKRQALGETLWAYTALTQEKPTPWWEIDFPLLNYRAPAWIAWHYHIRGLLYWGSMCYWQDVDDPWIDATYREPKGSRTDLWNGDGILAYPARAVGYDGIVPSIRLKAIRDSIEDYEYLSILERTGKTTEAEKIVLPLASSWFKWETDAGKYDQARQKLADLIVRIKHE